MGSGLGTVLAGGVIRSMGTAVGGGLGCCGLSCSLNGMYLVSETGLSEKVTVLTPEASEMKLTAVSLSKLCVGPDGTEILA